VPGWDHQIRTGFPFHPKAQADGTDIHNISGLEQMVNTTYPARAAKWRTVSRALQAAASRLTGCDRLRRLADIRTQASIQVAVEAA
jgi:hypothetical protein